MATGLCCATGDGSEEKSWVALSPLRRYFFDGISARASSVRCSASSYGSIALPRRIYQAVIFGKPAAVYPAATVASKRLLDNFITR